MRERREVGGRGREVEGGTMRRGRGSLRDNEAAVVTCESTACTQVRNSQEIHCSLAAKKLEVQQKPKQD